MVLRVLRLLLLLLLFCGDVEGDIRVILPPPLGICNGSGGGGGWCASSTRFMSPTTPTASKPRFIIVEV